MFSRDMYMHEKTSDHRKRKRRRAKRLPISAKLIEHEHGKGHVGAISWDFATELFGLKKSDDVLGTDGTVQYIAMSPWQPPSASLEEDGVWTIVPVRAQEDLAGPASIRFPASSLAIQSFASGFQWNQAKSKTGFDVLVLDVQPLVLETIFVKVDGKALKKHDEVQKKFGGGFQANPGYQANGYVGKGKRKVRQRDDQSPEHIGSIPDGTLEDRLRAAIRMSLAAPTIVHKHDLLPLPLPAHPITHVPFPPIKITACEPVDQGLLSGDTKIVIDMDSHGHGDKTRSLFQPRNHLLRGAITEEDEDTAAEQFYSAVENEESDIREGDAEGFIGGQSSTTDGSDSDDGSLSDESADNLISLSSPLLMAQPSGMLSSKNTATPRGSAAKVTGINTPGSVYSNYTATTARQGKQATGRTFQTRTLLSRVPDGVLHPTPRSDEDDEARVFVDIKMLVRLGCFSGDWVKMAPIVTAKGSKTGLLPLAAFEDEKSPPEEFTMVKIYGLPDLNTSDLIRHPKNQRARRNSYSSAITGLRAHPNAYISPILFINLGQPANVALAPLSLTQHIGERPSKAKVTSASIPPMAKEVSLLRLPTPISTERAVQPGLLANLKCYFETRRRILKKGDLVAITVDLGLSRIFSDTGTGMEPNQDAEELVVSSTTHTATKEGSTAVAWFRVGNIAGLIPEDDQHDLDGELWGGSVSIEPMATRMVQVGSDLGHVPATIENPWEYYLGIKRAPQSFTVNPAGLSSGDSLPKPYISSLRRRIRELLAAATSPQAQHLRMKPIVILLHSTQRNIGKTFLASTVCADLGLHVFPVDAYDILSEGGAGGGDVNTEASLRAKIDRALTCGADFTVPLIRHAEALTAERIASALSDMLGGLRALIVTTTEIEKIPEGIRSLFTHEFEMSAPDEIERGGILRGIINTRGAKLAHDVDLAAIAIKTAALVAGDLVDVVERAFVARQERLDHLLMESLHSEAPPPLIRDILVAGGAAARCVTKVDFDIAVDAARKNFADSIGAPKIPNVSWDDVGGLTHVKDAVMETIQLPLERPELFSKGMKKRSGILFYGPPGTGKTLLAKAIATEFSLNFFSVKGPELLNMYIGESEANVRRVFQRARDARPCVVFFDELDSVAPKRGNQGDSGGVMDRIVSQLLAELDGMSDGDGGGGGVFVIGATNRPDLLDQALLRPGRFDKMLYLGVSDTHDKQLTILEALTRKFTLHPNMSLRRVAASLPFTYTGADLYALCSDAMLKAITRQASSVDSKIKALPGGPVTTAYYFDHLATKEDIAVMVEEDDFHAAQRELVGSVSAKELDHYQRVRATFEGPPKPHGPPPPSVPAIIAPQKPKPRAVARPKGSEKGKGKATQWDSDGDSDDDSDDDDDAYVTSNDYGTPAKHRSGRAEGKGKGVDRVEDGGGFGNATEGDEEMLYG